MNDGSPGRARGPEGASADAAKDTPSGLLLYCIYRIDAISRAAPALPAGRRGVGDQELRVVERPPLGAVVSPIASRGSIAAPRAADLLRYQEVVEAQHAVADVLPARFGSALSDEAAVSDHLHEKEQVYLRALDRTAGMVEMGLRALFPAGPVEDPARGPEPSATRSGADYLRARQRRFAADGDLRERAAALERSVTSAAATIIKEHRAELTPARPRAPAVCSLFFLVPRGEVAAFRAALAPITGGATTSLLLSGPWPPYSFV